MTSRSWRGCFALLLIAGCANPGQPPVAERSPVFSPRPDVYTVNRGDTLYSIAWRFNLDFRQLAQANELQPPYRIIPGQKVRLAADLASPPRRETRPPTRVSTTPDNVQAAPTASGWVWPTAAPVSRGYAKNNSGLDFALTRATPIKAAAAGVVVYAGTGLGSFRQLVIIKHDEQFLSAYNLQQAGLVVEGESVRAGQLISNVTNGDRTMLTLHFEIRKDGQPVDPRSKLRAR